MVAAPPATVFNSSVVPLPQHTALHAGVPPACCSLYCLQTEAQRWVEKLHNLYSSGAVVPLPFLRAVDAAPLTLLGMERGPPGMQAPAAAGQAQVGRCALHVG